MQTRRLAFALMLSISTAGHAASFDCTKARTPVEKMICADRTLGSLDEQIAARYRQVVDRLDARYRPKLLASQRLWLKSRIAWPDLKTVLATRLNDLEDAIVSVNGLTFLRTSGMERPPYLMTALPGTSAYNQWVDQVTSDAESDDADVPQIEKCDAQATQGTSDDSCDGLSQTSRSYQIDFASPDLISVHQSLSISGWHAAHPSNEDTHGNWWLRKPGQIGREQIFTDQRYMVVIQRLVKETFNFDVDIKATGNARHPSLDPRTWGLTTTGLDITCQGYDFSIGRGSPILQISWSDFGGVVNPALLKMLAAAAPITDPRLKMRDN